METYDSFLGEFVDDTDTDDDDSTAFRRGYDKKIGHGKTFRSQQDDTSGDDKRAEIIHDNTGPSRHDSTGPSGHDKTSMSGHDKTGQIGHDSTGLSGHDNTGPSRHDSTGLSGHDKTSMSGHDKTDPCRHDKTGPIGHDKTGPIRHDKTDPSRHDKTGPIGHDKTGPSGHDKTGPIGHDKTGMSGHDKTGMSGHDKTGMSGHDKTGMSGHDKTGMSGHDNTDGSGHDNTFTSVPDHLPQSGHNITGLKRLTVTLDKNGRNTTFNKSIDLSPINCTNLVDTVMTFQQEQQRSIANNLSKVQEKYYSKVLESPKDTNQPIRMLLLGKTGYGKSATGNTILSETQGSLVDMVFKEDISSASITGSVERVTRLVCGREITVVDTPGLCDTEHHPDVTLREIACAIEKSPEGYDAFIFVLRFPLRMTHEEHTALKCFEDIFGTEECYRYSIALFTHGDSFNYHQKTQARKGEKVLSFEEEIFKDDLSNKLGALGPILRRKCQGGIVLFNNHEEDPIKRRVMVNNLIDKIDDMMANNNYQRYSNHIFEYASSLEDSQKAGNLNIELSDDNNIEGSKEEVTVAIMRYMKRITSCCLL